MNYLQGYILILLLCVCGPIGAQELRGLVTDTETGKPIALATCKLLTVDSSLVNYTITQKDGRFTIPLPAEARYIEVSHIAHDKMTLRIDSTCVEMEIGLLPKSRRLEELIVKSPAIVRKKDTLNYNVESFRGKNDHYLEDVIKKMPGLDVDQNGTIKYQGKSISRFNIEGQDMLGGRYNLATQNMPAEAVATVQVLENNQAVRALEGRESSDQTTLNIKLKAGYKMKIIGELQASGGGGGNGPAWEGKATAMRVEKRNQTLLLGNTNNTGRLLSGMQLDHFATREPMLPQPLVDDISQNLVPIAQHRYIDNTSHSASLNQLLALSEYSSIVVGLQSTNEETANEDSAFHHYGGLDTFDLAEKHHYSKQTNQIVPTIRLEVNHPKYYLSNEAKAQFSDTNMGNRLNSNGENYSVVAGTRPNSWQNKLKLIINSRHNSFYVNSFFRFYDDQETLNLPSSERLGIRQFLMSNEVATGFNGPVGWWNVALKSSYVSARLSKESDRSGNHILTNSLSLKHSMRMLGGTINLTLPFNWTVTHVKWSGKTQNRLYPSPSLTYSLDINPRLRLLLSGECSRQISYNQAFNAEYYSDYRTLNGKSGRMGWSKTWNADFSLRYQSILHLFNWYLSGYYSWAKDDHYFAYDYTGATSYIYPVWETNSRKSFSLYTGAHKVFRKGVFGKLSLSFARTEIPMEQNKTFITNKSNFISAVASGSVSPLPWLELTEEATGNISWTDGVKNSCLRSLYNEASLTARIAERVTLRLASTLQLSEITKGHYVNNLFVDAEARWQLAKRWSLVGQVTNLFNRKQYVNSSLTALSRYYYCKPLRQRELLLKVHFKF